MGVLIDGIWRDEELSQETGSIGEFRRADSHFRGGSSGFKAEPDRYHLYVAHGCPWVDSAKTLKSFIARTSGRFSANFDLLTFCGF
jgi:glutathionyl-hydroquinone reductase